MYAKHTKWTLQSDKHISETFINFVIYRANLKEGGKAYIIQDDNPEVLAHTVFKCKFTVIKWIFRVVIFSFLQKRSSIFGVKDINTGLDI